MIFGKTKKPQKQWFLNVLLLLFALPAATQSNDVLAKSFYLKAEKNFKIKQYTYVIDNLDKVVEYLGNTNPKVEVLYVKTYLKRKDYQRTDLHLKKYFEMADEGQDDYMKMLEYVAEVKEKLEAFKKENERLEKIISGIEKGKFTDPRDGQYYPIITIKNPDNENKLTIMARDLNYEMEGSTLYSPTIDKYKYGRLYDWEAAINACPPGWHLPSDNEWKLLIELIGGKSNAGKILKSKNDWTKYRDYEVKQGANDIGFNAIGSGAKKSYGRPTPPANLNGMYLNQMATYWSSDRKYKGTQGDRYYHASTWLLHSYRNDIINQTITPIKNSYYSCRCFKD